MYRRSTAGGRSNGVVLRPAAVERKGSAGDISLTVIVVAFFELTAKYEGVVPANPRNIGRDVELGIVIGNKALALRTSYRGILTVTTWRERRTGGRRDFGIVSGRPSVLGEVEA